MGSHNNIERAARDPNYRDLYEMDRRAERQARTAAAYQKAGRQARRGSSASHLPFGQKLVRLAVLIVLIVVAVKYFGGS